MTLTTTTTLIGLAAAALVAWDLGGVRGAGIAAGFLTGTAVTGFGVARQRQVLRRAPERALRTMVESFLLKLGAVVLAVPVLFAVAPVRQRIDALCFFLAFAAAVPLVLFPGTWDNARILKERRAE